MEFVELFLDNQEKQALYMQLYTYLLGQIQVGRLKAGEKLPGKRAAAAQLGVSVNTINEAYQMLVAEGYMVAQPRSGFVVAQIDSLKQLPHSSVEKQAVQQSAAPNQAPLQTKRFSFATGDIDTTLFPRKMYTRIFKEVLAGDDTLFGRGEGFGDSMLRSALAGYLQGYRGVQCGAEQIVVGAGLEALIGMLGRLFVGKVVALESPGYGKTAKILQNVGVSTRAVLVDDKGLLPEELETSGAQVAYVTPSHQFPTGGVMPIGRRMQLLRWAAQGDNYIIEDDYDSEFRFDGRPLPCLQGLDTKGQVVYAGTFSRSLAPGLRVAYLVLPHTLLGKWKQAYGSYACTVPRTEQDTLARFITGGHFSRSLNRMRVAYRTRRNLLLQALEKYFVPNSYVVENKHTGLYLILRIPGCDALVASKQAKKRGIWVSALQEYLLQGSLGNPKKETGNALVLGYGGLQNEEIDPAVRALAESIYAQETSKNIGVFAIGNG